MINTINVSNILLSELSHCFIIMILCKKKPFKMNNTTTTNGSGKTCNSVSYVQFDFNIDYTSTIIVTNHIIFCVVNASLSVLTTCLNFITAVAYWKSTQLRKKVSYFLIMVLSLNDFGVGAVCSPILVALLAREISLRKDSCLLNTINLILLLVLSGGSFHTLVVLNFERYFGIVHPIIHRTKVTKSRLVKCLIILWLGGAVQVILTFFNQDVLTRFITVELFAFVTAFAFIHVKIYLASRRTSVSFSWADRNSYVFPNDTTKLERKSFLRNLKLAKSCFIVVVCFFVCFLPGPILVIVSSKNDVIYMAHVWSETLILVNPSLNSIVFFWRNRTLRKEALRVLKRVS